MSIEAKQVPLYEQLEDVPLDARLVIEDSDGMGATILAIGRMCHGAAAALRAAIEQAEKQEPVAWIDANHLQHAMREPSLCQLVPVPRKGFVPLYATLREWQGLTDEDLDIRALWDVLAGMKNADGSIVVQFAKAIEAKLKEKNT